MWFPTSQLLLGGCNLLLPTLCLYKIFYLPLLTPSSFSNSSFHFCFPSITQFFSYMPKLICSHQKSNFRLSPIKMKRNCNLELRLVPAGIDEFKQDSNDHRNELDEDQEQEMRRQQITIFYGGKVCVCDVTELQARAILSLARREMEDKLATTPERSSSSRPVSPISLLSPQVYCADNGLSMKKSLQRFLQKRKTRIQATSPYNIGQSRRNGVVKSFM